MSCCKTKKGKLDITSSNLRYAISVYQTDIATSVDFTSPPATTRNTTLLFNTWADIETKAISNFDGINIQRGIVTKFITRKMSGVETGHLVFYDSKFYNIINILLEPYGEYMILETDQTGSFNLAGALA